MDCDVVGDGEQSLSTTEEVPQRTSGGTKNKPSSSSGKGGKHSAWKPSASKQRNNPNLKDQDLSVEVLVQKLKDSGLSEAEVVCQLQKSQ